MENTENIHNADYFAHILNEDLVTYFTQLLHSRMELVQYIYPGELLEDADDAIIEHINRCQGILFEKLQGSLNTTVGVDGHYLKQEARDLIFKEKKVELFQLFNPIVEKYFEDVVVKYADINTDLIDIDFWGRDYSNGANEQ